MWTHGLCCRNDPEALRRGSVWQHEGTPEDVDMTFPLQSSVVRREVIGHHFDTVL